MGHILLGVTGSIAAYRAAEIANILTKDGHAVHTILTRSAMEFITPLTFQTLTKQQVYTDMFAPYVVSEVEHISLAKQADVVLIAPASANFIAKAAAGIADDMLTTTFLAVKDRPILICPAMNTAMYENRMTQRNLKILAEVGCQFVEPREARLACGDLGKGALADIDKICVEVRRILEKN